MADSAQIINLLPDEKLKLLRVQRVNALVTAASVIALVVVVVIIIVLIGAIEATQFSLTQKKNQITQLNTSIGTVDKLDDGTSLQTRATAIQSRLALIKTAFDARQKRAYAATLNRLVQIVPPTVSMEQLSIDASGNAQVSGIATTYNEIGRFAQAITSDGDTINVPSSGKSAFFGGVSITQASFSPSSNNYGYTITFELGSEADSAGQ
jgi:Tfp pilus assembly protein PilN